ncbi:MAG: hypothetical protein J6K17_05150 [Oscillospiraceae bacterium]|nr:hypothetical protein [Oscillospiraceae bacterium]
MFDGETYFCPNCETSEHTVDWKCPHCGDYVRITAEMDIKNWGVCRDITFVRKNIFNVEVGDRITCNNNYIYEVLNKLDNFTSEKDGCFYRLSLKDFGLMKADEEYYNCVF